MQDYFAILVQPCSQAEAEAGTNNDKPLTPLRVEQQFAAKGLDNTGARKNFGWNLDSSDPPNALVDGTPDPGDPDYQEMANLDGIYYDGERACFHAGRLNHRCFIPTAFAQYAGTIGWGCFSIDPYDQAYGAGGKGQFQAGYQCIGGGSYSIGLGFNQFISNGGFASGFRNIVGSRYRITAHAFVDDQTSGSIAVSGDRTSVFTADSYVCVMLNNGGSSTYSVNRVVSSSYDGGTTTTTINLALPLDFQWVAGSTLGTNNVIPHSYVASLGAGNPGFSIGADNRNEGNYSVTSGVACLALNAYSQATGVHAVSKNKGELAWASEALKSSNTLYYSQESTWQVRTVTTNNTPKVMSIDGESVSNHVNNITTQNESAMLLDIKLVCKNQYDGSYFAHWPAVCIEHQADGDTTIIAGGTPTVEERSADSHMSAHDAALSVDTDGKLIITVTGSVDGYRDVWTATIRGTITGNTKPSTISGIVIAN